MGKYNLFKGNAKTEMGPIYKYTTQTWQRIGNKGIINKIINSDNFGLSIPLFRKAGKRI